MPHAIPQLILPFTLTANKEGGQPVRFNQYLQFYLVNLKFRQVVSIYIVNRFESPYNMVLIQLPSLIRLTQYRSRKHHSICSRALTLFFFFCALSNESRLYLDQSTKKVLKKKNEANLVETNKFLCPSFFKMCLWNMNPIE